jgi:uncharacterized tellurite resistance protein B-like protein
MTPEHQPEQLNDPAEAFAAIAVAAVACDGQLNAVEARRLRQQLECRRPFSSRDDVQMAALLDRLLELLRQQGFAALVAQAAPLLSSAQRETALAVAADLTAADHIQTGAEQSFLGNLAEQLQIAPERSRQIIEVIGLLNGDSLTG